MATSHPGSGSSFAAYRQTVRGVWLVVAVMLLCGCSGPGAPADGGSTAFPADTAQDWVTYGDYLVELTAVREQTLPPDDNELMEGEGVYRRQFTLPVEQVWWTRPGVKHRPPTEQTWVSGGWQFRDGNLQRRKRIPAPNQLEVGRHYLALCTHDARGQAETGEEWWCFNAVPVVDGKLRRIDEVRDYGKGPIFHQLRGLTPAEAGALLQRTPPDPSVVPYLDRDAPERYQLGFAAREAQATPTPTER